MIFTSLEWITEVCYGYLRFDMVTTGLEWLPGLLWLSKVWYGYHRFGMVTRGMVWFGMAIKGLLWL